MYRYKDAAKIASKDADYAAELSAAILEQTVISSKASQEADRALDRLSTAGKPGREALKRLSIGNDPTARVARIAYDRFERPTCDALAQCVKDSHPQVRKWCALAWNRYMSDSMLTPLLSDMDPEVRLHALRGLAALPKDSKRASLFADALRLDPDERVRIEAASHGDLLGDDALLLLKDRLSDQNLGMRTAAVSGIARIRTEAAYALLTSIAEGPRDQVSLRAQAELSSLGNVNGRNRLLQSVEDEKASIRAAALYLLSSAKIEEASKIFAKHLYDKSPEVVLAAANLLRNEKDFREEVLAALVKLSKRNIKESVRADDLAAEIGDEKAVEKAAAQLKKAIAESEKDFGNRKDGKGGMALILTMHRVKGIADGGVRQMVISLLGNGREEVRIEAAYTVFFSMSKI